MKKKNYARLYVQDSMFWEVAKKSNFSGIIGAAYKRFKKTVSDLAFTVDGVKSRCVSGFCASNSHYDIDKAIEMRFTKEEVSCDSESGMFSAFCTIEIEAELTKFILVNYPDTSLNSSVSGKVFDNWWDGKNYCKENNIEVEFPKQSKEVSEAIIQVDKQLIIIEKAKEKLKEIIGE
jgi:hypothetical protein